jgi:IS5 family transposase
LHKKETTNQLMTKIQIDTTPEKGKDKYRVANWSFYNKSLVNRGNITLYFDESAVEKWYSDSPCQRGGQEIYSDVCIEAIMMLKTVFKLPYRQTEGFVSSLLGLMSLDLYVPSYTQINRRANVLQIAPYKIPSGEPIHIAIDSTGVKIFGEGEWKVRKHGYSKRRTWRKLHLGVDPASGFIHAYTLTDNKKDDSSQVDPLLNQIETTITEVSADGAYDMDKCWKALAGRKIKGIIPPRENAVYWTDKKGKLLKHRRNDILKQIDKHGMAEWKKRSGYHKRSLSETSMFRYKTIHGPRLYSRKTQTQNTEVALKIKSLNIMTATGMPVSVKIQIKKTA